MCDEEYGDVVMFEEMFDKKIDLSGSILDLGSLNDLSEMANFVHIEEESLTIEDVQVPLDDITRAFKDERVSLFTEVLGKEKMVFVRVKSGWKIKWKNVGEQFVRCILGESSHEFNPEAAKDLRTYAERLTKEIDDKSGVKAPGVPHVYMVSLREIVEEKGLVDKLHPSLKGVSFPRNMFTNLQKDVVSDSDGLRWDKLKNKVFFYTS